MAQRGARTTFEERIKIGERWEAGQTDPEIAAAMGLSVCTVRKWRRKHEWEGRSGLTSRLGKPPTGALEQFPMVIRDTVRQMREENSGWGAVTIRTEPEEDAHFAGMKLPSRSRIAAFLKQEGYTGKYERHSELPQPPVRVAQRPHEEWAVDAQGVMEVSPLGCVSVINISLDRDSVFYDNTCASPYPTTLHLWLIALGIEVRFIEKTPRAEHSVIERNHQTMTQQSVGGRAFGDAMTLQNRLPDRRDFLNLRFPSRSLDGQPLLVIYPEAQHSGGPYHLEWEEALLDTQRVYDYLAQGRWFRRTSSKGQFSLGTHRYGVGKDLSNQTLESPLTPRPANSSACRRMAVRRFAFLPADSPSPI